MTSLGDLTVQFRADVTNLTRGTQQAQQQIRGVETAANEASSKLSNGFGGSVTRTSGSLLDFASKAGMAIFAIKSLADTAMSTASALLAPAASAEQIGVAFTTLFGSTKAAQEELSKLNEFAARTPFQTEAIDQAAAKMKAFGFETSSIIPYITSIGDALSSLGKGTEADLQGVVDVFGQINATGHLTAQDMMQLSARGIPAWKELAAQMGVTVPKLQDMVSKGLVPADVALRGISAGMEKAFGGGMQKQSNTLNGLLSTFQSNIKLAWDSLLGVSGGQVKKGSLFAIAEQGLKSLGDLLSSKQFQKSAEELGKSIGTALAGIGDFVNKDVLPGLREIGKDIMPVVKQIQDWAVKNDVLAKTVGGLKLLIDGFVAALQFVVPIIISIDTAIVQFIAAIVERLQPTIAQLAVFWHDHFQQIQAVAEGVWNAIAGIVQYDWALISGIVLTGIDILTGQWGKAGADLQHMAQGMWAGIKKAFGGGLQAVINTLIMAADPIFKSIVTPFYNAYNEVLALLQLPQVAIPTLSGLIGPVNFMGSSSGTENTGVGGAGAQGATGAKKSISSLHSAASSAQSSLSGLTGTGGSLAHKAAAKKPTAASPTGVVEPPGSLSSGGSSSAGGYGGGTGGVNVTVVVEIGNEVIGTVVAKNVYDQVRLRLGPGALAAI